MAASLSTNACHPNKFLTNKTNKHHEKAYDYGSSQHQWRRYGYELIRTQHSFLPQNKTNQHEKAQQQRNGQHQRWWHLFQLRKTASAKPGIAAGLCRRDRLPTQMRRWGTEFVGGHNDGLRLPYTPSAYLLSCDEAADSLERPLARRTSKTLIKEIPTAIGKPKGRIREFAPLAGCHELHLWNITKAKTIYPNTPMKKLTQIETGMVITGGAGIVLR